MDRREFLLFTGGAALATGISLRARAQPPMCPTVITHEIFHTPADARLPADGGVVVGLRFDHEPETSAPPTAYTIEMSGRTSPLQASPLAPGLRRLVLPRATGRCIVHGPAGARTFELTGTPGGALAAPHITRLEARAQQSSFAPPGSATFHATVREPVPRDVVAVIAYRAEPSFAKCFALVTPGRRELFLYRPRTHCDGNIEGENPVSIGDTLRLAYVDAVGRLSAQSNHLTVPS